MNNDQVAAATECAHHSSAGKIHFGEVIGCLMKAGVERYHADYSRCEITYYTPDGGSCVVPMSHKHTTIGLTFSAADVASAVREAQLGDIMYPVFTRKVLIAGCVGYFVQITGKCVQYFGRNGEMHVEWFPGAKGP